MGRWKLTPVRVAILLAALSGAMPPGAAAQLPGQDAAATRALAVTLLTVELALKERPPSPDAVAEVNRSFDRASLAFFSGQVDAVVLALASLVESVEPDAGVRARQRAAAEATLDGLDAKRRVLEGVGHPPVPFRLHGPPAGAGVPLPVVVALHGAGGNEHMFLEAYGAGRIRELADSLGFVVVSPSTTALARGPQALAGLLDAAGAEYAIDRSRVFLLGHSMGAAAAWTLAERFPEAIAAVACIAGGCGGATGAGAGAGADRLPPLLMVAGELDPIAARPRMEASVAQARERGVEVEYRVVADQGHTLLVGAVLDDVVSWLLSAPGSPRSRPPA